MATQTKKKRLTMTEKKAVEIEKIRQKILTYPKDFWKDMYTCTDTKDCVKVHSGWGMENLIPIVRFNDESDLSMLMSKMGTMDPNNRQFFVEINFSIGNSDGEIKMSDDFYAEKIEDLTSMADNFRTYTEHKTFMKSLRKFFAETYKKGTILKSPEDDVFQILKSKIDTSATHPVNWKVKVRYIQLDSDDTYCDDDDDYEYNLDELIMTGIEVISKERFNEILKKTVEKRIDSIKQEMEDTVRVFKSQIEEEKKFLKKYLMK